MTTLQTTPAPIRFAYRLTRLRGGSDKFGPCECCAGHVDTTYIQTEMIAYDDRPSHEGYTHHRARPALFGHRDCLIEQQRTTAPEEGFSYYPPLETICPSCGAKHVGPCGMHACKSNEREAYIGR